MSYSSRMNMPAESESHEGEHGGSMTHAFESAEQCVQEYPTAALMVTFGAGFLLGYMLTGLFTEPEPQRGRVAEFSHKTWEALAKIMPDTIAQRMQG